MHTFWLGLKLLFTFAWTLAYNMRIFRHPHSNTDTLTHNERFGNARKHSTYSFHCVEVDFVQNALKFFNFSYTHSLPPRMRVELLMVKCYVRICAILSIVQWQPNIASDDLFIHSFSWPLISLTNCRNCFMLLFVIECRASSYSLSICAL